jgi:acetylornithine deacetylase/succinyl-diaminopimelate desuccinylase-like protein
VIGGFTDCNAFRAHGLTCYGFIPMRIGLPDIGRIHGHDERIRISALSGAVLNTLRLAKLLEAH